MDYLARSLKSQLKTADRLGVLYTVILGEIELQQQEVVIRNMFSGEQKKIAYENLVVYLGEKLGGKER